MVLKMVAIKQKLPQRGCLSGPDEYVHGSHTAVTILTRKFANRQSLRWSAWKPWCLIFSGDVLAFPM